MWHGPNARSIIRATVWTSHQYAATSSLVKLVKSAT